MTKFEEILLVLRSGALAVLVPLMVKLLPLPAVLSILRRPGRRPRKLDVHNLERIAGGAVRRGPRFGVGECLVRSLVLFALLRSCRQEPVLLIGGRLSGAQLDCHCWIEIDGKLLCESNDPRVTFTVLYQAT